jgi:phosphoglucosamine mutase
MSVRFGTDGVRGLAIAELTPVDALNLGRAAAQVLGGAALLVARDPRRSGPVIEAAFAAGVAAEGVDVQLAGVLPTPAVAHLAQVDGVPAAVITASHNPFHDNGVKLFAAGGRKLDDAAQERIEATLADLGPFTRSGLDVGAVTQRVDAADSYVDWVCAQFPARALHGERVVIDAANGAMSEVAPRVLRRLGADVVVLHADPDGTNINRSCGATAPQDLARAVVDEGALVGLAFDGDGDRVIAADHTGAIVDGDRLIALFAEDLRDHGRLSGNTVVVTVMSNLGFHRAMAAAGIEVVTTPVGDRSVLEALDAGGHALGGEQSGHIIRHDLAPTGDGLLAGVMLLELLGRRQRPLAELAAEVMTSFPQVLLNVPVTRPGAEVLASLAPEIRAAEHGLGDDGRVLVRASGTEPLIRVMVEASTADTAQQVAERLAAAVRGLAP